MGIEESTESETDEQDDSTRAGTDSAVDESDSRRAEIQDTDPRTASPPSGSEATPSVEASVGIGIVARGGDGGAVARAILRARRHGHQPLVSHPAIPTVEAVEFAKDLDVPVIDPGVENPTTSDLRAALEQGAAALSLDRLVFLEDVRTRVDYPRTHAALEAESAFLVAGRMASDSSLSPVPSVVVGIPAFQEADSIRDVVTAVREHVDDVIVVDDGSTDDTGDRARSAGATVISHDVNLGYGAALRTLFETADRYGADRLVIIDADGQHDAADIPTLLERLDQDDADVVVGSRFIDGADTDVPRYRRFGLAVVNGLTNLSLGRFRPRSWIRDTQSGFRVYDRPVIESLGSGDHLGTGMSASIDVLQHVQAEGFTISEVPTTVRYDVESANSQHPLQHGLSLVRHVLRVVERRHPIAALGVPGVASVMVGFGFGYWTLLNYATSGTFAIGLAFAATFFGLAGILASFTAIILHALNHRA